MAAMLTPEGAGLDAGAAENVRDENFGDAEEPRLAGDTASEDESDQEGRDEIRGRGRRAEWRGGTRRVSPERAPRIRTPKPKVPSAFSGEPEDVEPFGRRVLRWLGHYPTLSEEEKVLHATDLLEGDAATWWDLAVVESGDILPIKDVKKLITKLGTVFPLPNKERTAREKLDTLKQLGSVADYTKRFRSCIINIRNMSGGDKLWKYVKGLKNEIRKEIETEPMYLKASDNISDVEADEVLKTVIGLAEAIDRQRWRNNVSDYVKGARSFAGGGRAIPPRRQNKGALRMAGARNEPVCWDCGEKGHFRGSKFCKKPSPETKARQGRNQKGSGTPARLRKVAFEDLDLEQASLRVMKSVYESESDDDERDGAESALPASPERVFPELGPEEALLVESQAEAIIAEARAIASELARQESEAVRPESEGTRLESAVRAPNRKRTTNFTEREVRSHVGRGEAQLRRILVAQPPKATRRPGGRVRRGWEAVPRSDLFLWRDRKSFLRPIEYIESYTLQGVEETVAFRLTQSGRLKEAKRSEIFEFDESLIGVKVTPDGQVTESRRARRAGNERTTSNYPTIPSTITSTIQDSSTRLPRRLPAGILPLGPEAAIMDFDRRGGRLPSGTPTVGDADDRRGYRPSGMQATVGDAGDRQGYRPSGRQVTVGDDLQSQDGRETEREVIRKETNRNGKPLEPEAQVDKNIHQRKQIHAVEEEGRLFLQRGKGNVPSRQEIWVNIELRTPVRKRTRDKVATPIKSDALLDSGASHSFVSMKEFKRLKRQGPRSLLNYRPQEQLSIVLADGRRLRGAGKATFLAKAAGHVRPLHLHVIDGLCETIILGQDWLQTANPHIDWLKGTVKAQEEIDSKEQPKIFRVVAEDLPKKEEREALLKGWKAKYHRVFEPFTTLPPRRPGHDLVIEIPHGTRAHRSRLYRMTPEEKAELVRQTDEHYKKGWIKESKSPWAHACLFAKKITKSGKIRVVYDYRAINSVTKKVSAPVPRIDDLLDAIGQAVVYSKLDLAKAYNQLRIAIGSEEYTAFITPNGLYHWLVMPFGLCNAGGVWQQLVEMILRGRAELPEYEDESTLPQALREARAKWRSEEVHEDLLRHDVLVYLDDILIGGSDIQQHISLVDKVLERFFVYDIRVNEHLELLTTKTEFLGFVLDAGKLLPMPDRVEAVKNFPQPRSVTDVRAFLGIITYYRTMMPGLSEVAVPLTNLTKKDSPWRWTHVEEDAFKTLKQLLVDAVPLHLPDPTGEFVIATDASLAAAGGVLMQRGQDGCLIPIAFYSKKFSETETRYPIYELELLAIVIAVRKWRCYIGAAPTTVFTDHRPLETLLSNGNQVQHNKRVVRWLDELQQYDLRIKAHSCKVPLAAVPDALSRIPEGELRVMRLRNRVLNPDGDNCEVVEATEDEEFVENSQTSVSVNGKDREDASIDVAEFMHLDLGSETSDLQTLRKMVKEVQDRDWAITEDPTLKTDEGTGLRLYDGKVVMPRDSEIQAKVLEAFHDGRHRGIDATVAEIRKHFYWTNARDVVTEYVKSCETCARQKPSNKRRGLLSSLETPTEPLSTVAVDFVTDLPDVGGMNAVATVTDRFTCVTTLIPMDIETSAAEFAKLFMEQYYRKFGLPNCIVTDRDGRFTSKWWQAFTAATGINQTMTVAYRSAANGQAERMNRTCEEILRCLTKTPEEWLDALVTVEFIVNTTKTGPLKSAPFETLYGKVPRGEFANWTELVEDKQNILGDVKTWMKTVKEKQERVHAILVAQRDKRISQANESRLDTKYKEGDLVWLSTKDIKLRNTHKSKKLQPKFIGPYEVIEAIGSNRYKLALHEGVRIHPVFPADKLKPYTASTFPGRKQPRPAPVMVDGEYEWTVEKLVGHRIVRGKPFIVVQWRGYGVEDNTTEPAEQVAMDVPDLYRRYVAAHGLAAPVWPEV